MRRRRSRLCVVGVLTAVLTVACGSSREPSTSPGTSDAAPADFLYVSLGDSYTAAPLVPEVIETDCYRSSGNYPNLVAEQLPGATLIDVSCGGADTTDMTEPQNAVRTNTVLPPQANALTTDTDLVTVGIGANDYQFFSLSVLACAALGSKDPEGNPCERRARRNGGAQTFPSLVDKIQRNVEGVLDEVQRRAPQARVLLVNYPQYLPDRGSCLDRVEIAAGDYTFLNNVSDALTQALSDAALRSDVDLVDVHAASQGHDVCAADPWVAGGTNIPGRASGYHPFPEEQAAVADLILEML